MKDVPYWQICVATLFFILGCFIIIYDSISNYYENSFLDWAINFICLGISVFLSLLGISTLREKAEDD